MASHYKQIDGKKYSAVLLEAVDAMVAGKGDGRISKKDAESLFSLLGKDHKYSDLEKETMAYIRDNYKFTTAGQEYIQKTIQSWKAARGDTIDKGSFVQFHFDLFTEDGSLVASTKDADPLAYVHGVMQTDPPALGEKLAGKPWDFQGTIILSPDEAYGERIISYEDSMRHVPLEDLLANFPEGMTVEKGAMFQSEFSDQTGKTGQIWSTIMDVQDDQVLIYFGHPLAGQNVRFEVEIIEVREATEEDVRRLYEMYNIE